LYRWHDNNVIELAIDNWHDFNWLIIKICLSFAIIWAFDRFWTCNANGGGRIIWNNTIMIKIRTKSYTTIIYYYFMWVGTSNRKVNIILLYYCYRYYNNSNFKSTHPNYGPKQCCATWNFFVGNLYNIIILAMIYSYSTGALVGKKRVELKRAVAVLRQINFHGRTGNGGRYPDPLQD